MSRKIVRVGNALAVEIPEEIAAQAALQPGDAVEWVSKGIEGIALVRKAEAIEANSSRRLTLDELLEGIPEGTRLEECDWGPARGAEIW